MGLLGLIEFTGSLAEDGGEDRLADFGVGAVDLVDSEVSPEHRTNERFGQLRPLTRTPKEYLPHALNVTPNNQVIRDLLEFSSPAVYEVVGLEL